MVAVWSAQLKLRFGAMFGRAAMQKMVQEKLSVVCRHEHGEGVAEEAMSRPAKKLRSRKVDLLDSADAIEAHVTNGRELVKIDISLDGRFNFSFGRLKNRRRRGFVRRAVLAVGPIRAVRGEFLQRAGRSLHFFHGCPNYFARRAASRCLDFAASLRAPPFICVTRSASRPSTLCSHVVSLNNLFLAWQLCHQPNRCAGKLIGWIRWFLEDFGIWPLRPELSRELAQIPKPDLMARRRS
jgi:hypothetical protein